MPFNLCGHICLAFSLVWGFACLLVVRVFHPVLMALVALILAYGALFQAARWWLARRL